MPPPLFTTHPLLPTDIPSCVTIYFTSFATNAHSLGCWPRTPAVRAWWESMLTTELTEPRAHWLKAVHTESGALAGFAKWVAPREGEADAEEEELPSTWPEGADVVLCEETFGAWAARHRWIMAGRRHWYLEIVAVAPSFQGQGAGRSLLQYGCVRADAEGLEAYLEASPAAVRMYERMGWREAERLETWIENARVKPGVLYRNLFMIRAGRGKGGLEGVGGRGKGEAGEILLDM